MIRAGRNGFRHLLRYAGTAYVSGQIRVVKYMWRSRSETSEWSRADRNNGNKDRKRCNIITVPPTNGPCPHGLTARPSSSGWLSVSSRRISTFGSVRMSSIEIYFKVKVLVGVDIISVLPCIVFFGKTVPPNLELESISEPLSIDVLLHDPEILIIDFHRRWSRFPSMWDRIGDGLGKDINVKYIMNFPFCEQGESIREIRELLGDLKRAVSFARQFWRWLVR
jgi:hypothetical protein